MLKNLIPKGFNYLTSYENQEYMENSKSNAAAKTRKTSIKCGKMPGRVKPKCRNKLYKRSSKKQRERVMLNSVVTVCSVKQCKVMLRKSNSGTTEHNSKS